MDKSINFFTTVDKCLIVLPPLDNQSGLSTLFLQYTLPVTFCTGFSLGTI